MKHAAIVSPLVAIALAAVLGATAPAAATEYVTRNCDGLPPECGQWHYNDTWDPSGIPGPGDTARLQLPVEVRLAADVTSLVLESGHQLVIGPASHPSANLNTWGVSDWQAGNITGNGSLRQWGILRVTGSSDRTCRARLENHGTVQVEMWFDVTLGDGGVDNTDPAGTIDLQTDADLLFYSAGDGLLNSGTIRK